MKQQGKFSNWLKCTLVLAAVLYCTPYASSALADEGKSSKGRFIQERSARRPSIAPPSYSGFKKRLSRKVLEAFEDTMKSNGRTAVRVMANGEQVALGVIVDSDGWIVTKASQIPPGETISCITYDYRDVEAQVVNRVVDVDLALLRISASGLPEAQWANSLPSRGSFVATADLKMIPSSVGVVSASIQAIQRSAPILGVQIANTSEGASVTHVMPGTGASEAGIKKGDNIVKADETSVRSLQDFKRAIRNAKGGDFVSLRVQRGTRTFSVNAKLMDLTEELLDDTEMEVNGAVSARATDFARVFSHDSIISPNQCGGPIVNLDGEIVGINIARAGRVNSYALPFDVVRPIVDSLVQEAKLVSKNPSAIGQEPVR